MLTTDINDRRVEPWIGIAGRANGTSGRVFGASAGDIGTAAPDIQTVAGDIRIAAPASRRPAAAIRSSAPATGTTADANFEPAHLNPTPARDIDAAARGNRLPAPRNRRPLMAIRWRHQPINCPHRTAVSAPVARVAAFRPENINRDSGRFTAAVLPFRRRRLMSQDSRTYLFGAFVSTRRIAPCTRPMRIPICCNRRNEGVPRYIEGENALVRRPRAQHL